MYFCTCLCMYVRIYVFMYVSMCLGMYLCTYLCSYHDSMGSNLAFSSTGKFALSVAIRSRKISVQSGSEQGFYCKILVSSGGREGVKWEPGFGQNMVNGRGKMGLTAPWSPPVGGYNNSCRSSSSRKGVKEEKGKDARNRVYGAGIF